MGCFTALKGKKKRNEQAVRTKSTFPLEAPSTTLPEPQVQNHLQSAPSSFKTRTAQPNQPTGEITPNRARAFSAPSSIRMGDRDLLSAECNYQEDYKTSALYSKEIRYSSPHPLPLPSPQGSANLKNTGSFELNSSNSHHCPSGPLPLPPLGNLKYFSYEEIAAACHCFLPGRCLSEGLSSASYKASFREELGGRKLAATVTRFLPSTQCQGLKEFIREISVLASVQHPQLCKLIGYHAKDGSDQRMLLYERLFHGSLDSLLSRGSDGAPMHWWARTKVALCAAQGLSFLHEEGPPQAMFCEFSSANIQVDKDFNAKLSGYGRVLCIPDVNATNASLAVATSLPEETTKRGLLTPKSNVWCFGIVLLELLTGRRHLDLQNVKEERDIIKWSRPFLSDDSRLSLIMDPRLKGRFPTNAARLVADMAQRCLQKDPSERPTMRAIMESLKDIQEIKYSCRFRLQEPTKVMRKQVTKSPSLTGIVALPPRMSFSPSPPSQYSHSVSPARHTESLVFLARTCSSVASIEEKPAYDTCKASPCRLQRHGVEGF